MSVNKEYLYNYYIYQYNLQNYSDQLYQIFLALNDLNSNQCFYELEKFFQFYISKYDLHIIMRGIYDLIINSKGDAKKFIFSGDDKNAEKIKAVNKEKKIYSSNDIVIEGVFTCIKCHKKRIIFKTLQIRSADEAATTWFKCTDCDTVWYDD